jgi:hypothetical protein
MVLKMDLGRDKGPYFDMVVLPWTNWYILCLQHSGVSALFSRFFSIEME